MQAQLGWCRGRAPPGSPVCPPPAPAHASSHADGLPARRPAPPSSSPVPRLFGNMRPCAVRDRALPQQIACSPTSCVSGGAGRLPHTRGVHRRHRAAAKSSLTAASAWKHVAATVGPFSVALAASSLATLGSHAAEDVTASFAKNCAGQVGVHSA